MQVLIPILDWSGKEYEMLKLNKILITFLLLIIVAFTFVWKFVQSETFAKLLSRSITKISKERLDTDIKFERITFKLFPPGVELYNVSIQKKRGDQAIDLDALRFGVEFNLLDSFETKLTINNVYMEESKLVLKRNGSEKDAQANNKNKNEINPQKILTDIFDVLNKKLPVRVSNLSLKDFNLIVAEGEFAIRELDASIDSKKIDTYLVVDDINLENFFKRKIYIDRLQLNAKIERKKVIIREVLVLERQNKLKLRGEISRLSSIKSLKYKLSSDALLDLQDLHDYLEFKKVGEIFKGQGKVACNINGIGIKFDSNCELDLYGTDSDFVYAERITSKISINNNAIYFNEFKLQSGNQDLELKKPFEFFNFKTSLFIEEPVYARAKNFKFDNALRYLRDTLEPLRGEISGEVTFTLGSKDFHFVLSENSKIENLSLNIAGTEIIGAPVVYLKKANFDIEGIIFNMDIHAKIEESDMSIRGSIGDGKVNVDMYNSYINLGEFNKFSGFSIKGRGPISMRIDSPMNAVKMNIVTTLSDFNFEQYMLDEIQAKFQIDLEKSLFALEDINGRRGRSLVRADGAINYKTTELGVEVYHPKLYYNDMRAIYYPLQKDLTFLPERFLGAMDATVTLGGKTNLDELKAFGRINGTNIYAYDESIDEMKVEFTLQSKFLNYRYIELKKARGKLLGIIGVDLSSGKVTARGNVKDISLNELSNFQKIPLNIQSDVDGTYVMNIDDGRLTVESQLYFNDAEVGGRVVGSSYFDFKYNGDELSITGDAFNSEIKVKSILNFSENFWSTQNKSSINVDYDVQKLEYYLPMFDGISESNGVKGALAGRINSSFNVTNWKSLDLSLGIEKLSLKKSNVDIDYMNKKNEDLITVNKGVIENWDFQIRGENFQLISKAEGNFLGEYEINSRIKIDASILEIFDGLITKSSGAVLGKFVSYKKGNEEDYEAIITSNNLAIATDLVPTEVKNSIVKLSYKNRKINFDTFKLGLNKGTMDIEGFVNFQNIIPELSLKYTIRDAGLTFFKKTNIELNGNGAILGSTKPYTINGDILITKAIMNNEFNEIKTHGTVGAAKVKYLPENTSLGFNNLFNFNVSISSAEPARINNTMAELSFSGNLQLLGTEIEPRLAGKVSLTGGENILLFQNNEFHIARADIFFNESRAISNPEIDFIADATISKYNINARVYGPVDDFKTTLTSDPSLPQQNILSLIALGYTEDFSNNLTEAEKESITRAGIGSLIFDSFKINQTLKNEFGLSVNLGTVISKDEGSYLTQQSSETSSNVGRVRSATKIEVKKEINEDVSMSVTSTVGGTSAQKQSMNLNYNIHEGFSVEGVYENQTQDDDEQDLNANSLGADLKWKWFFK